MLVAKTNMLENRAAKSDAVYLGVWKCEPMTAA